MRFRNIVVLMALAAIVYFGAHYLVGNEGGQYTTVGSISSNMGSQMKSSYQHFEGTKYRSLFLVQGDTFHLEASVKTEEGSLTLSVLDPQGVALYSISDPEEPLVLDLEILVTGEYRLQLEGDHKGGYVLDWQ